jgi:MoaA/NifB/PqqE/SkfB family radical SAM enzyme
MTLLRESAAKAGIPLSGMFELTKRCNLRCGFCYVADRQRVKERRAEKTAEEWLHMISQAARAGMLVCTFTGGEPFIREDFEEIYCKAYDMGLRIAIFTNASLIGEGQLAYLRKRPPALISVSVYGASEKSYRELCGDGAAYPRVMKAIKRIHEEGFHMELKALPLMKLSEEFESIGRLSGTYGCTGKLDLYIGPGRDGPARHNGSWRLPSDELFAALTSFYKGVWDGAPAQEEDPAPQELPGQEEIVKQLLQAVQVSEDGLPCLAGQSSFFIAGDGRMMGCPTLTSFETFPFSSGFLTAWKVLYHSVAAAEECPECETCQDKAFCPACPAKRTVETGSPQKCCDYLKELAHALSLSARESAG